MTFLSRILPVLLILSAILLLPGCLPTQGQTVTIQAQEPLPPGGFQVQQAARQMYALMQKGAARKLCSFAESQSRKRLASQFPKSRLTDQQTCTLLLGLALSRWKKQPDSAARLRESLRGVKDMPVQIQGDRATLGNPGSLLRFKREKGRWKPVLPSFLAPQEETPDRVNQLPRYSQA